MVESIKVSRRDAPSPAADEDRPDAAPAPDSPAVQALRDAWSLLPSRDPRKNERFKLGLYAAVGAPLWYAAAIPLVLPHGLLPGALALFFALSLAGPLVATFVAAFAVTFAFYALQGEETRGRLRQALVCPYCRDEVGREGAVICARPGCGALYHDECWAECATQYGGCAVYGCSAKKSRPVSASGYLYRLARLGVAAVLFPPRMARALASAERESFVSIYGRAVRFSNRIAVSPDPAENPRWKMALYLGVATPIAIGAALAFVWWVTVPARGWGELDFFFGQKYALPLFAGLTFGIAFLLPRLVALPPALAVYTYRALAQALRNELAALARGDSGGGTVLGRLAAGFGKKNVE